MYATTEDGPMAETTAAIRVLSPGGVRTGIDLRRGPVTIGRASPGHEPDVALGPDPQWWVGRLHCTLDLELGTWFVTDKASVNGTLIRRAGTVSRLRRREALRHGDELLILADMTPAGDTSFWTLTFIDPHSTRRAPVDVPGDPAESGPCLRYDWVAAIVYRRENGIDTEISGLRPQEHQLLRYMADRSQGAVAVACGHEELIRVLWGDRDEWPAHRAYTRSALAGVVMAVRRRIEPTPSEPRILQTVTGIGYRLRVYVDPASGGELGDGTAG